MEDRLLSTMDPHLYIMARRRCPISLLFDLRRCLARRRRVLHLHL